MAYLSDGGHHDNSGLLALFQSHCAEIWCIDSADDDAGGSEGQVFRAVEMAKAAGIIDRVDLDWNRFNLDSLGLYNATDAMETIRYVSGGEGVLRIVKLGLTIESHDDLKERAESDRVPIPSLKFWARKSSSFPYLPTFPHQVYSADRASAFIHLGRDNASRCLANHPRRPRTMD